MKVERGDVLVGRNGDKWLIKHAKNGRIDQIMCLIPIGGWVGGEHVSYKSTDYRSDVEFWISCGYSIDPMARVNKLLNLYYGEI